MLTEQEQEYLAYKWNPMGYNDLINRTVEARAGAPAFFKKTDVTIATVAAWRAIMGKVMWWFVNYNNPAFGALRKVPWTKSGERIVVAEPATAACAGIGEQVALPTAQVPSWNYHATQFKQVATRFQITRKMIRASQLGDDTLAEDDVRNWAIKHNALEINKMILRNVETDIAALTTTQSWVGTDNFECLDRIISCDEEEDDVPAAGQTACYDPWTKYETTCGGTVWDRDSGYTHDAVIVHADGTNVKDSRTNFTGDVAFNLEAVDTMIDLTHKAGADRRFQFFLTGYDTARKWAHLISPKQRFENYERIAVTVNGMQSVEGVRGGFRVALYDDIPIVVDANCPTDGASRLFLIDSRSLFFKVATPTFLTSPDEATSYGINTTLTRAHWLLTEGELWCTNPKVQGKMRSIAA